MKLSDIKGERTLDVIADLVEPVANIASDKEVMALFQGADTSEVAEAAKKAVPQLLKRHRDDVMAVLSTLEGETPEEYAEHMTLPSVLQAVYEILTDEELLAFLSLEEAKSE